MSFNIATQNICGRMPLWRARKRALARHLRTADVLLLQEVQTNRSGRTQAHDLAEALNLPHTHFASAGQRFWQTEGVAILSRWPVIHAACEKLPQSRRNPIDTLAARTVCRVLLQTPIGKVEIYALHMSLLKPIRTRSAHAIAAFVRRQRDIAPAEFTIIGGDFNASPHEPCLKLLQSTCNVRDIGTRGKATFPTYCPVRRLDYLLVSPQLQTRQVRRSRSLGSDHCGVVAEIEV